MPNCARIAVLIASSLLTAWCLNTTKFMSMKKTEFESRANRLLSFNTLQNGDITMELAFNVPFITIPVKTAVENAQKAIADVNLKALGIGGVFALGFVVVIPAIVWVLSKKTCTKSRDDESSWLQPLALVDRVLTEHQIDGKSCIQQLICKIVKEAKGKSTSTDKIIEGIITSNWMQRLVQGTFVQSALETGLKRSKCLITYKGCEVSQNSLDLIKSSFLQIF